MNAERLLQHFDRIAEAPDAVPRLKRFILDLAVRGKLVEQDPNEEPAAELLKRIEAEKARLVAEQKLRHEALLPKIAADQEPFQLPKGWAWSRLGEVINLLSGQHLQPTEYSDNKRSGPPYVTGPADFGANGLIISRYALVRKAVATEGQLLLTVKGAGVGKTTTCNIPEVAISRQLMALTAISWNQHFLSLTTHLLAETLKESARSLIPGISRDDVKLFVFGLPPLAEQHRIVTKVDELTALCDQLEVAKMERDQSRDQLVAASLHRLNQPEDAAEADALDAFRDHARFVFNHLPRLTFRPAHIKQLRQTILNLAVRGKLVPQDPNDELASELLKRVEAEKIRLVKQGTIKHQLPVLPLKVDELLPRVPDSWRWVRLSDLLLGDSQNGYSKKPDDAPNGIPILRISAGTVRKDGIVAEEEHKLIGGVSVSQQKQFQLQPGDLLACRFNGNRSFVGKLSLYTGYLGIKPIYPDKLIRLRLLSQFILPKLVMYFAESNDVRRDIESYCATTVGNWGISASNLKEVKIPLPPFTEQHRIVAKIDELIALCDQLEARLATTEADGRRLLEAVLHEALAPALEETA